MQGEYFLYALSTIIERLFSLMVAYEVFPVFGRERDLTYFREITVVTVEFFGLMEVTDTYAGIKHRGRTFGFVIEMDGIAADQCSPRLGIGG